MAARALLARANSVMGSEASGGEGSLKDSSVGGTAMFGLGEAARVFQETVFGIVAVMSKGSQRKLKWFLFELVVVSAQYVLFPLQFYSWEGFDPAEPVRRAVRAIIPFRLSSMSFGAFLAVFWASAVLVLLVLATALYVGYAFANQNFRFMFPLKLLRFGFGSVVGLIYMPLISVFSTIFNCPLPGDASKRHLSFGDDLLCWSAEHLVLVVVAAACSAVFSALVVLVQLLFFETDYYRVGPEGEREYFSRPHSRVDAFFFVNNVALSILINLEAVPRVATALVLLASGLLFAFLLLEFYPYHRLACNALYTGLAFAFAYASLACLLDAWLGAARLPGLHYALVGGLLPAFAAGACASVVRFRLRMCTGDSGIVARIKRPLHVEIATRFLYEAGPHDEEAADVAEAIFRAAVEKFPSSASILLCYAQFCFTFRASPELGHERVRQAARLSPGFDLRFVIYRRELQRQQSAHAVDLGDAKRDLIVHIEYTSNLSGARKYHRLAVRSLRKFWNLLGSDEVDLAALEAMLARIDAAERKAHGHYRALLSRYPRAPRILRAYGRFQADVLNDESAAQSLFEQADSYEDERVQAAADADGLRERAEAAAAEEAHAAGTHRASGTVSSPGGRAAPFAGLQWSRAKPSTLSGLASTAAAALFARRWRRKPSAQAGAAYEAPDEGPDGEQTAREAAAHSGPASFTGTPRGSARAQGTTPSSKRASVSKRPPEVLGRGRPAVARSASRAPSLSSLRRPSSLRAVGRTGSASPSKRGSRSEEAEAEEAGAGLAAMGGLVDGLRSLSPDAPDAAPGARRRSSSPPRPAPGPEPEAARPRLQRTKSSPALAASAGDDAAPPPPVLASAALLLASPLNVPLPAGPSPPSLALFGGPPAAASPARRPPSRGAWEAAGESARAGQAAAGSSTVRAFDEEEGEGPAGPEPLSSSSTSGAARSEDKGSERKGGAGEAARPSFEPLGGLASSLSTPAGSVKLGRGRLIAGAGPARPAAKPGEGAAPGPALLQILDLDASARAGPRPASPQEGGPDAASEGEAGEEAAAARRGRVKRWVKIKRRIQGASNAHAASLKRMRWTVIAVLVAVAALAVASFVVCSSLVHEFDDAIVLVGKSGSRRRDCALSALHAQSLLLAGTLPWDRAGGYEAAAREGLRAAADELEAAHVGLYKGGARVLADTEPQTPVTVLADDEGDTRTEPLPLWGAALELVSNARRVARMELATLRNGSRAQRELFFIHENAPTSLYTAFIAATNELDKDAVGSFQKIRQFLIAMFVAVTCLLLVLAFGFFRPTVASVQREKAHALGLFRDIPRSSVRKLAQRGRAGAAAESEGSDAGSDAGDSLADFDDVEEEAGADRTARGGPAAERKAGPGGKAGRAGAALRRLRRLARLPAVDRVTAQYGGAFFLLFALFAVWFAVGMTASDTCETFSTERNFAGLLKSLPIRIQYHARAMVVNPADAARQRRLLAESIARLEEAHHALLFGNATEHLRGAIHRYPPSDALLFKHACFATAAACASGEAAYREGLEALYLRYLEEAKLVLSTADRDLAPDNEHLAFLEAANMAGVQAGMDKFAALFVEEGHEKLAAFLLLQTAMFAAVVVLLVLEYLLIFRRIMSNLTDESRRTVFMFLMLPPDVIEATGPIKAHLYRLVSSMGASEA